MELFIIFYSLSVPGTNIYKYRVMKMDGQDQEQ